MVEGEPNATRATNIGLGAAVVAVVNSFVVVLVNFGVAIDARQEASITGVTNALVLLVVAFSHLYSARNVEREHPESSTRK